MGDDRKQHYCCNIERPGLLLPEESWRANCILLFIPFGSRVTVDTKWLGAPIGHIEPDSFSKERGRGSRNIEQGYGASDDEEEDEDDEDNDRMRMNSLLDGDCGNHDDSAPQ
eukprot:75953-Rhodomonas_salina.1